MDEPIERPSEPMRCAIVVDVNLAAGKAANAAAVVALTIGKRHPELAGADLIDAGGDAHPGLIPIGIAVLAAETNELPGVRARALKNGIDIVDFPALGQQTTDYSEFGLRVRQTPGEELAYVAVGLYGTRKAVGKLIGKYSLLK